jgi:hypothetical protein
LYLRCLGFGNGTVDTVCRGGVDAPEGFTSRGGIALDERGARDLNRVNCVRSEFRDVSIPSASASPALRPSSPVRLALAGRQHT